MHPWVTLRGTAVRQLEIRHNYLVNKSLHKQQQSVWEDEARHLSGLHQLQILLQQATALQDLSSLKLVLTKHFDGPPANSMSLAGVWHQICMLSQLQSLTVIDQKTSRQLAEGLFVLSDLSRITSLHLQRGHTCPPWLNPSHYSQPLAVELDDLYETLHQLDLQHLTLAIIHFDTDLRTFWEVIALPSLTNLKLEYITLHDFNYFDTRTRVAPVEMPAVAANLMNLRSLTMRCCGFRALPAAFAQLANLKTLDIVDPYDDLRVLQHMPALTWLRVYFNGIDTMDRQKDLAFAFPPNLHFMDVNCNVQRLPKGGGKYLRRLDQVLLAACFHADVQLRTARIHSLRCFSSWQSCDPFETFSRLMHLQEVALLEAGLYELPDGPWLHQLKVLDLRKNAFLRIPPVLLKHRHTLREVDLWGALQKRRAPVSKPSATRTRSRSSINLGSSTSADAIQDKVESEFAAAARGDEAFSAARCRADYDELVKAGVHVQIDADALLDSYVQKFDRTSSCHML